MEYLNTVRGVSVLHTVLHGSHTVVVSVEDGVEVVLLPHPSSTIREGKVLERVAVLSVVILSTYQHAEILMIQGRIKREVVTHLCLELGRSRGYNLIRRRASGQSQICLDVPQPILCVAILTDQLHERCRLSVDVLQVVDVVVTVIERHKAVLLASRRTCQERSEVGIDGRESSRVGITHSRAVECGLRQLGNIG